MSFVVTETYPASGNAPAASADLAGIRSNWSAIESFFTNSQHYTFTSALSGCHMPGIAGFTSYEAAVPASIQTSYNNKLYGAIGISSTYADIMSSQNLTSAYGLSQFVQCSQYGDYAASIIGTSWTTLSPSGTDNIYLTKVVNTNNPIPYTQSNGRFTVKTSGYYLVSVVGDQFGMAAKELAELGIFVNGLIVSEAVDRCSDIPRIYGRSYCDIVPVVAGDYITCAAKVSSPSALIFPVISVVRLP
jgi:hypothetical protein